MKTRNENQKKRAMAVAITVSVLVLGAGLALAQGPGHGSRGDEGPGHRLEMMAEHLDLTPEQEAAIGKIQEQAQAERVNQRKEMMRLRNELKGEMLKDNPSQKTVLGINEKMGRTRTELRALRLKTRLAVRELLTPEQRDKMLMMGPRDGHQGRKMHGGHGGHGDHGGCRRGEM